MSSHPLPAPSPAIAGLPCCDGNALALLARIDRPVWIYDFDAHRIVWANAGALRFWQAGDLAELQGRDFVPTALGTADRLANLRHALAEGGSVRERWTFYPNGQPSQRECRMSVVRLDDGQRDTGRLALMVEAGDEPIEAPDAQAYERRAIEAVRQSPLMISLVTDSGHWLMHNPAAEALMNRLGAPNIPHFDNFVALFAEPEQAATIRAAALEAGAAGATLRMAGEGFRMHEVMLRRLADPVTGRISLMMSQQDVTRAYRLERRLQKALAREKGIAETQRQFLLMTSHDFRTPLSIIDAAARRIGKLVPDNEGVADRVRVVREAVHRMSEAVDNTLATASIAEGKVTFLPRTGDIGPLIARCIANQQTLHPARRIEAEIGVLPQVSFDPALSEQVIENLLTNAIKYSPPQGLIRVRASAERGWLKIAVKDQGIGIPADDVPRLFARFFRSRNAQGVKGTGLGLHAVRYFMGLHGGTVDVDSMEGRGSTFTLAFPLSAA